MIEFILASSNPGKAKEFQEFFLDEKIRIISSSESLEIEESGNSFAENALLKANGYYNFFKCPVVADDSGLIVESLPNELGVYSARFGKPHMSYTERCHLLLEKMERVENRNAYFSCTLCCFLSPEEIYFFEGRVDGRIATEIRGEGGFGFDPLFIPKELSSDQTFAEISEWKKENSHRARAVISMKRFFEKRM